MQGENLAAENLAAENLAAENLGRILTAQIRAARKLFPLSEREGQGDGKRNVYKSKRKTSTAAPAGRLVRGGTSTRPFALASELRQCEA
jgi:hypothetical protein